MKQHPKSLMSALNIETDVHSKLSRNSLINKKGWACSLKIKCSFGAVRTLTENTNSVYLELDGQKKSCATLKPLELSTLNSMNTRSLGRGRMSFCRKLYLVFILLLLSPSQRDQQLWEIWSLTVLSAAGGKKNVQVAADVWYSALIDLSWWQNYEDLMQKYIS